MLRGFKFGSRRLGAFCLGSVHIWVYNRFVQRRELEKKLRSLGWRFLRHGGRHDVWTDGEQQEAIPRHNEINEKLAKSHPQASSKEEMTMRLYGRIYREGRHWLVEIPLLDAMTQGSTKKEAYAMAAELVETLVGRAGFKARVYPGRRGEFELGASPTRLLVALMLRRQREASGLSLAEVASRLGAKSRNTYARYEQGVSVPTIEKLNQLLRVVTSGRDVVLQLSSAA